ncbi:galactose mutarotase-like isoform X2 [Dreissena polymorpha]|uniref:galactose mutarotase-like isoform X2 n=1 Tax=Dreissena polymorpha TaxID=45954 RepID=UPI002264CE1C|nr:galactose mutarotase-like isoform X2 [Dreissena polymorpha]
MPIQRSHYDTTKDGQEIDRFVRYVLSNNNQYEVHIITYGGIITNIFAPDKEGLREDVVLGLDTYEDYTLKSRYFGAIIGRYGNRIGGAQFHLDGVEYSLAANNFGKNGLHGGNRGFDKQIWEATVEHDKLVLHYMSPDSEEGYPGNLDCYVTYQLTPDNKLNITYFATTDKPTIVNMTNHSYFNLNGHAAGSIGDHVLTVNAPHYLPIDKEFIPLGTLEPVEGTAMDLRTPTLLGDRLDTVPGGFGFDHNFCLGRSGAWKHVARLYHPGSGRCLNMYSTEPGVQVYSGGHMPDITGKGGNKYRKFASLCLESQHYPNSPHHMDDPNFPPVILRPGETYTSSTCYEFSVVKTAE